jgi:hypothetical protein
MDESLERPWIFRRQIQNVFRKSNFSLKSVGTDLAENPENLRVFCFPMTQICDISDGDFLPSGNSVNQILRILIPVPTPSCSSLPPIEIGLCSKVILNRQDVS